MIDRPYLSNIPPVADVGNRARRDCGARSAPRPITLSNGTFNNTYEQHTAYEIVEEMAKIYPDMVKIYTFKNPFKKNRDGFDMPPRLTSTTKKTLTPAEKEENKDRSLRRTRKTISDIVSCNDFDKFVTFTFDPKKHDAYNREYCQKIMKNWLNNQKRIYGDFRYILVTEHMDDGKTHFHALFGGYMGKYHQTKTITIKGKILKRYKIDSWEKSNGFADMSDIGNKNALGAYVGKYITKELDETEENKRRYWASKNLQKPVTRYNQGLESIGLSNLELSKATTFDNEHCEIVTIPFKNKIPLFLIT